MSDISINIGHVILEGTGVQTQDGERIGRVTETALQRLLNQKGVPLSLTSKSVREIITSSIHLLPNGADAEIAEELALSLHRILRRTE
jgi:hypothetical protein